MSLTSYINTRTPYCRSERTARYVSLCLQSCFRLSSRVTLLINKLLYYVAEDVFQLKFGNAYNKCIEKMFGYARRDSMTGVFIDLSLHTLDTVVNNSRVLFANQSVRSCNKIVQWFLTIRVY